MFPVSWIIQSRLADVATIVDENVNGVRVVKSFAAEEQQLRSLAGAADKLQWGYIKDADLRARFTPLVQNLPQVGLALVLLFGGYMVIHGGLGIGAILAFNFYLLMLQAPFMMLGMLIMMGQRAAASADRIYEILDEQPTVTDGPDAVDLVDCRGDVRFDHVDFAYAATPSSWCWPTSTCTSPRERRWPWSAGPEPGKSTVARLLTRFYDVKHGSVRDRRPRRAGPDPGQPAGQRRHRPRRALPLLGVRPGQHRLRQAVAPTSTRSRPRPRRPAPTSSSPTWPTATTRWWASGATRSPAASASGSPSPAPCWSTRPSWCSTTPPAPSTSRSSSGSTPDLRVQMEGRTTLIIAHRLSTISLADRVVLLDQHKIVADGTHAELLETTPLYAEVLAQAGEFERRGRRRTRPSRRPGWTPTRHRTSPTARRCGTCSTRCGAEAVMMFGGGGGGGFGGPGGAQASAASGLPFAGIPSELQDGVDQLLAAEPEYPEPDLVFTQNSPSGELKRLSLWRLLTKYRGMLALAGVLVVVIAVAAQVGPKLTEYAINDGMGEPDHHVNFAVVVGTAIAYLVFVAITALAQRFQVQVTGRLAAWVMNDLRVKVFAHLQRLSLGFFTEEKAGVIMSRMTSDIENLQQLLQDGLSQLAIQGLTMVVITVILFTTNVRLAVITVVLILPALVGASVWFKRASERGYDRVRDGIANVLADLSESLHGVRIVTAHNRQRHNVIHHRNVVGDYRDANNYTARCQRHLRPRHPAARRPRPGRPAGHRRRHGGRTTP